MRLRLLLCPAGAPAYLEDVGIEGHDKVASVDKAPYPDIDRVLPHHPPEIEAPAFHGICRRRLGKKERKLIAVPEEMLPCCPERFPDIAVVIASQHRADTAELIDDPLQGPEQGDNVFILLEPVIETLNIGKIPLLDKFVGTFSHKSEEPFEERPEGFYLPIGELGGEETGDLPVVVLSIPADKCYRVVRGVNGEMPAVPVIYGLEINGI